MGNSYRPPPAQAQAQPAQAQAHAQERPPPPPLRPPLEPLVDGLGGGLVTFVTRLVKSVMLPMTFCEKVWTPFATDEAKSEPGRCGTEGMDIEDEGRPPETEAGRE